MIGEGRNINVTLIFLFERYAGVVKAYLSGLEDLRQRGGDLRPQLANPAGSNGACMRVDFVDEVDVEIGDVAIDRHQVSTTASSTHSCRHLPRGSS
jgi:hypothetical protein